MRKFLEAAHQLFELHIYTHGDAGYAREMAALLDPSRRLFAERIISQACLVWGCVSRGNLNTLGALLPATSPHT